MMNVLITNVGRRGYLVEYLKETPSFKGKVFVSDCDKTASGLYGNNDGQFILPKPVDNEELYVEKLKELCKRLDVSVVIPVIDPEIYILSNYRESFLKDGINIIVSNRKVLDICYSKSMMNDFLKSNGFLVPATYENVESFENDLKKGQIDFPIMLKPIYGSGSAETYKIENLASLRSLFHDGMIIQEFLVGEEFGADVFNTFDFEPVRCVVKKKISMRSGETDKAMSVENKDIQTLTIDVAKKLGHIGNLDCDIIKTNRGLFVIDMNPRFGGGYPATHATGTNLIGLLVDMVSGKIPAPDFDSYKKNLLVMKEIKIRVHAMSANFCD